MTEMIKSEEISRRKALSFLGFGCCVQPRGILSVSEAEAQTVGTERRHERRAGRTERRQERRTGRTERRETRRTT